jgi:hypothetical protein
MRIDKFKYDRFRLIEQAEYVFSAIDQNGDLHDQQDRCNTKEYNEIAPGKAPARNAVIVERTDQ